MAKNFIAKGDVIDVIAGGNVASGSLQVVNDVVGVALNDAVSGESYPLALAGVFEVTAETALAMAVGERLFYDSGNGWLDLTAAGQLNVGTCALAKDTSTAVVWCRLGAQTVAGD